MISNERVKHIFAGNGATKKFQIPFDFFQNTAGVFDKNNQITVIKVNEQGQETILAEDTDYEVETWDPSDSGSSSYSGYVILSSAPAVGEKLVIMRDVPITQELNLQEGKDIGREELEAALDKIVMTLQQLNEKLGRAICYAPSTPLSQADAGKYLSDLQQLFTEGSAQVQEAVAEAISTCAGYAQTAHQNANQTAADLYDVINRMTTAITAANNAASANTAAQSAKDAAEEYKNDAETAATNAAASAESVAAAQETISQGITQAQGILDEIKTYQHKEFEFIAGTADEETGYTGSLTEFNTGINLSALAVEVHVNGVHKTQKKPAEYSISGTSIIFATAVALGASVVIAINGNLPNDDIPEASETVKGIVSLASEDEVEDGTNDTKAITPSKLSAALEGKQDRLSAGTGISISGNVISASATGSALKGIVVANSTGISKAYASGSFRTNVGTSGNIKFITLELCNEDGTVWKPAVYSHVAYGNRSGNFATIYREIDMQDFTETQLLSGDTYGYRITVWY